VLIVRKEKFIKKKKIICDLILARTNSCVDTHDLHMINNRSKTGFGYIHRPG
jgi:hypothetical protein